MNIRRKQRPPGAALLPYPTGRWRIIKLLTDALTAGIVLALRHRFHDPFISRLRSSAAAVRVLAHKGKKQAHVERIAERIAQLEGTPSFPLEALSARAAPDRIADADPIGMLQEDLTTERLAIQTHREMIHDIGGRDPTTRRLLEGIVADEEEHAEDMNSLLEELGGANRPAPGNR